MDKLKTALTASVAMAALSAAGTAFAICSNERSDITVWLEKSGQGNLVCEDFAGPGGATMTDVTDRLLADPNRTGSMQTQWTFDDQFDPSDAPDVAIVEAADGRTCLYQYLADLFEDSQLTAPSSKNIKNLVVCSDGEPRGEVVAPVSDPGPIATGDESCSQFITTLQQAVDGEGLLDIAFGVHTKPNGNEQQLSFCSDRSEGGGQTACVNRCETPIGYPNEVGKTSYECEMALAAGQYDEGRLPIECRRCALSSEVPPSGFPGVEEGTQYCWELYSRVDANETSFRPVKLMSGGHFEWQRIDGSLCYLMSGQTDGGYPYSYWVSLDGGSCPCDPAIDDPNSTCLNF